VPVWRELGNEILADFDEHAFGIGWWAPHPGTSRRILISDHLYSCVRSVETNLVEARLHLLEAMDFWERDSEFYARAVTITRGGRRDVRLPERTRPLDEIPRAMSWLHVVGFIRAIAGALDCFGASVVGVAALRVSLLYSDLDRARRALSQIAGAGAGQRTRREFGERLERVIEEVGPLGWLRWAIDLRNMLIHRGRRLQMSELRPVPSGIVDADGRPVIRTDVIHQLPRDPGRSDVEMFLGAPQSPVLTESAAVTLRSVLDSTLALIDGGGRLLLDLWHVRRAAPALLLQPRQQWPDGASTATSGFPGYAQGSIPYGPAQLRADRVLFRRMVAGSLHDTARAAWAHFD
jgi:hypothetical protein